MKKHLAMALVVSAAALLPVMSLAQESSASSSEVSSASSESSLSSFSSISSVGSSLSRVQSGPCSSLEGRYFAACKRKINMASRAQRLLSKIKSFTEKVMQKIQGLDADARRNLRREVEATLKACENTRGEERALCLKKGQAHEDSSNGSTGRACPADTKQCSDGSFVSRDSEHDCAFKECKGDAMRVCTEDAKICPDGTSVGRDPHKNCEFKECKKGIDDLSVCSLDVKKCSDGTTVARNPNKHCEFNECPQAHCEGSACSSSSQKSSLCSKTYSECPPPPPCAAPPQGCHYEDKVICPSTLTPNGCLLSCGRLECEKSSSSRSSSSSSKGACRIDGCGQYCVPVNQPVLGMACTVNDENKNACYKQAKCEVQSNGTCGWTMTQDARECLGRQK